MDIVFQLKGKGSSFSVEGLGRRCGCGIEPGSHHLATGPRTQARVAEKPHDTLALALRA